MDYKSNMIANNKHHNPTIMIQSDLIMALIIY